MTTTIQSICVFCGSNPGAEPAYLEAARDLGQRLAEQEIDLVYGGASIGLMGAVADAVLDAGGKVFGVMPTHLVDREVAHHGLTELYVTRDMHERKKRMADLSDGFIALPGGIGTLEELFEITTWSKLGIQRKPIGVLNTLGYYDLMLQFLDHMVDQKFLTADGRSLFLQGNTPAELLPQLAQFETPATIQAWLNKSDR